MNKYIKKNISCFTSFEIDELSFNVGRRYRKFRLGACISRSIFHKMQSLPIFHTFSDYWRFRAL